MSKENKQPLGKIEPPMFEGDNFYRVMTTNGYYDIPKNGDHISGIIKVDDELKTAIQVDIAYGKWLNECVYLKVTKSRKKPRKLNRLYRKWKRLENKYEQIRQR